MVDEFSDRKSSTIYFGLWLRSGGGGGQGNPQKIKWYSTSNKAWGEIKN